ncbi:MAG: glycosyl hydrolase family 17, partial [Saprospiraceae bacterium]|nr:glycosyl hydrolase family 17 [Saprospiraceae bacterium]
MKRIKYSISITTPFMVLVLMLFSSCGKNSTHKKNNDTESKKIMTAKDILGDPNYLAMSYGGYRNKNHDIEPTIDELKDDMKILFAMGVRIVRTYKVHLPQAANLLKAISELKKEDNDFEMYVMLGAWIDCKNAWTDIAPDHDTESEMNKPQIEEAVRLVNKHPDIVKIIAVGNEAMVKWAESY